MRDLFDKDPARETVDKSTVVFNDLVDFLLTEITNTVGKRVMIPMMTAHLQTLKLHLRNYMNTDESRHASLASKELKKLKQHLKACIDLVETLDRGVLDERLKTNQNQ